MESKDSRDIEDILSRHLTRLVIGVDNAVLIIRDRLKYAGLILCTKLCNEDPALTEAVILIDDFLQH